MPKPCCPLCDDSGIVVNPETDEAEPCACPAGQTEQDLGGADRFNEDYDPDDERADERGYDDGDEDA